MSNTEKLIDKLLDKGVTFPEGRPTKFQYCSRGDEPRTILSYECFVGYRTVQAQDAKCLYKGSLYNELCTSVAISDLVKGDIELDASDQFMLYIHKAKEV